MPNGDILGPALYQKRARKALPILVAQARSGKPIFYSELAQKVGMPNPRNLNGILECIGKWLEELSAEWNRPIPPIPPIQAMVISKTTRLPGEGIGWFFKGEERARFDAKPIKDRQQLFNSKLPTIYDYPRWQEVLKKVGLEPLGPDAASIVASASELGTSSESRVAVFGSGGEGEAHRRLKEYLARHPELINLPSIVGLGITEKRLPSGDRLDVFFTHGHDSVAAEVKSSHSTLEDVTRGIFQCVKYRAVLEAQQASLGLPQSARAVLVLEGQLAEELIGLRNRLGIEVFTNIVPYEPG